jgi:serine/threonine-protein kinase
MPDPVARLNSAISGRYRVARQLGEGGMATVYLADDRRKVALEVLKPDLARGDDDGPSLATRTT